MNINSSKYLNGSAGSLGSFYFLLTGMKKAKRILQVSSAHPAYYGGKPELGVEKTRRRSRRLLQKVADSSRRQTRCWKPDECVGVLGQSPS